MAKLSVKKKNDQFIVKRKLGWGEEFSDRELQVFKYTLVRGITRPNAEGKKLTYTVPADITLQDYLKSGIGKKEFFVVIAQIIEVTKRIEKYGLNINNLVLNLPYVYMNRMTKEINFIYQPVINKEVSTSIYAFVNDVAYAATFPLAEDTQFINDFMKYLQNMERYSATEIEQYILKKHPETYRQVKREQPKSTVLQSKAFDQTGRSYVYKPEENERETALLAEGYDDNLATGLLDEENDDDLATGLLYEEDVVDSGMLQYDDDLATGLLYEEDVVDSGPLRYDDDEMETTVLIAEDEPQTMLLNEVVQKYPYLIRLATYEQVEINKPVFRIGKERSYVDYFVANNSAVSRLHADIIERNNTYYIKDNNSTNRTYVNGTAVRAGQEIQINEGDQIMLANETFEFHW